MRGLAPAERKVVPPQSRAPCPPFSGWNDPLCNLLCSTVTSTITFQPSTFTFRTFVWNRGTWNLLPTTPSSCLPFISQSQSIPVPQFTDTTMSEPESDYGEEEVEDGDYEDRSPSPNYWWPPSPKDSDEDDEDDVDDEEDEDLPDLDGYLDGYNRGYRDALRDNYPSDEETDYSQTEGESEGEDNVEEEEGEDEDQDQTEPESEEEDVEEQQVKQEEDQWYQVERPHAPDTCRLRCRTRCRFPVYRPRS